MLFANTVLNSNNTNNDRFGYVDILQGQQYINIYPRIAKFRVALICAEEVQEN